MKYDCIELTLNGERHKLLLGNVKIKSPITGVEKADYSWIKIFDPKNWYSMILYNGKYFIQGYNLFKEFTKSEAQQFIEEKQIGWEL